MKIIITEDQYNDLKFRRRGIDLQKIRDMIEDQVEIQDPRNFEDAEEYAYFCVNQAICHYFKIMMTMMIGMMRKKMIILIQNYHFK
jgi:hypothetical protein